VDATDFTLTVLSGNPSGTISNVAAVAGTSNAAYDVTVSSISGAGDLRLDLKASGTGITDASANPISGGFTSGQSYTIQPVSTQPGFASVTLLGSIPIAEKTADKPQAKAWKYANRWWCVLSATSGTQIFRLDGTSWTSVLTLTTKSSRPDCWIVGNVVHILLYKGASNNSFIYSIEYDPATNAYKLWSQRQSAVTLSFPAGSETADLTVDGQGRMWAASAGVSEVYVWWSDAPYSTWSAPIIIATGVKDDDICAITAIPNKGKIGIFWSNQNTKRFGFKTHNDGASPSNWSADEVPASQSAIDNTTAGMADDHMNLKVASDGTLYCAAKTSYNTNGFSKLILLIRRPNGTWDNAYPVTMNPEGTQPIVILNETLGKLKVVYATVENGGDIVYRESSTSNISFGSPKLLFGNNGKLYDYVTSTHQNYNPDIVLIATNLSTNPLQAVSVLATDGNNALSSISPSRTPKDQNLEVQQSKAILKAYPNPSTGNTRIDFSLTESNAYAITLYDAKGTKLFVLSQGWAEAKVQNTIWLNTSSLANGLYLINIKTNNVSQTLKLLVKQ
jgi:hypothetical protein